MYRKKNIKNLKKCKFSNKIKVFFVCFLKKKFKFGIFFKYLIEHVPRNKNKSISQIKCKVINNC